MTKETLEKMIALATSAFGMVAALAWNEAIKTLFQQIFGTASGIISLFIYAAIITIVAVWVTSRLGKLSEKIIKGGSSVTSSENNKPKLQ